MEEKENVMELVKCTLLILMNKTKEQYYKDAMVHKVVDSLANYMYEFRIRTPEEYLKWWKDRNAEQKLRIISMEEFLD